ncbi:MAG: hypothetical protein IKG30_03685 [Clostridiales bacterium]|nr:hypothetical protein [Clostridiales bacterium]
MKKIKAIACVLTVAMLAGIFAGCSKTTKISTEKFAKACEKLKLEEYDIDDDDSPDEDDFEDGLYVIADQDYIEDNEDSMADMLDDMGLGGIIDVDDVKSMGIAMKLVGLSDIDNIEDPEDIEDATFDGALALVMELDNNYVGDVMDYVDDMLDQYDINTEDLSNKEYYVSKNDGFIRFHVDVSKLTKILLENDDLMDLVSAVYDEDDFEDLLKNLTGDAAVTVEVNGSNIFILVGGSLNSKPTVLNSFSSAFGVASNPLKLPMNNKFVEGLVQDTIDNYGDLASSGGYDDYDDYDFDDYDDYDDDYDYDDDGI